ncbi:MAG: hypothetical protein HKO76_00655 [Acidimicrobiia bacterium]|nr:hypothetical protein [Acidimicrobiia bacterium]
MAERTFSEDQIQALLKRATELHLTDEVDKPGLTLRDLEHIAADAGIPPKYLRAALHEADHQVSTRDIVGQTKTHVFVERTVPGELSDSEWESVVYRLRKAYTNDLAEAYGATGQHGRGVSEELGKTREWRHASALGVVTTLTIRSAEGNQHIAFQRRVGLASPRVEGFAYGLFVALLVGLVATAIAKSVLVFVLAFVAALAFAAPGIEFLDRRWRAKTLREMTSVADDIQRLIRNEPEPDSEQAPDHVAKTSERDILPTGLTASNAGDHLLELEPPSAEIAETKRRNKVKGRL